MDEPRVETRAVAVRRWCAMWKNELGNWVYIKEGIHPMVFDTEAEALAAAKCAPDNPVSF